MSAHTPGPWSWVDTSWEYNHIYAARKLCATVHTDQDVTEETEDACAKVMNANARLIAAAPRLLEELQRLVNIADSGLFRDRAELSIATHPAYDDARELIKSIIRETK